ncbi:hypothetical protein NYE48_27645 [Paenibacillus sp. FSL M7-1455]|uniref:hypothetical protein n=1 Tax=Paenibacillus sp. FSL M7-1455 TaxID=2975316 RepID=UPI0030F5C6A2
MSNVSKPVIPAEVADVIEYLRFDEGRGGYSNQKIIQLYEMKTVQSEVAESLRKIPFDTLLAALVNGYERELTEEERREEAIAGEYEWYCACDSDYDDGVCRGILLTLNTLGIKIEGVNA